MTHEETKLALFYTIETAINEECGLFTAMKNQLSLEIFNMILNCYREAAQEIMRAQDYDFGDLS